MQDQVRLLDGDLDDKTQLQQHLAQCPTCRALQQELTQAQGALQSAFAAAKPSPEFVARTMSLLPAAPGGSSTMINNAGPRVFTPSARRPWFVRHARLAAAFVFGLAGIALGLLLVGHERALAMSIDKGLLTDSVGNTVSQLRAGEQYQAKEVTVLTLGRGARVKAQPGSSFQLQPAAAESMNVKLTVGDVYASATNASAPLRVACARFEADLETGDFYVAQGAAEAPHGVVIVFDGVAQVMPQQSQPVALAAGQVFVSVVMEDVSFCHKFELRQVAETEANAGQPEAALRADYRLRVASYREQAAALRKQLAETPADSPLHAELNERCERLARYIEAHQRRLESMTPDRPQDRIPFQMIKDGTNGHTDPAVWLRS